MSGVIARATPGCDSKPGVRIRWAAMATRQTTEFMNVDLELRSIGSFASLLEALDSEILVLHIGRSGRYHVAYLELALAHDKTADAIITRLADLISAAPPAARRSWDQARSRVFNIGIGAGAGPFAYEIALKTHTIAAIAHIGASIVITTYGSATGRTHR
jgi:hypothetical protein